VRAARRGVCVCVCVCERERDMERDGERETSARIQASETRDSAGESECIQWPTAGEATIMCPTPPACGYVHVCRGRRVWGRART
jgi:hypothetical protein